MKRTILPALVLASLGLPHTAWAAEGGACRKARSVLGDEFKDASEERCQQALETADEDRWQLWLDVANAAEMSGDLDRAAMTLDLFLRDTEVRRLPAHWTAIRDEAKDTLALLDRELLKSKARLLIRSTPEGAELEVVGAAKRPTPERTPATRYLAPGEHTLRLSLDGISREVGFSAVAGESQELNVDLRPKSQDLAAIEPNPSAAGGSKTTAGEKPGDAKIAEGAKAAGSTTRGAHASVHAEPPRSELGTWTRVGSVAATLGGASLAAGLVFVVQAIGLDDEAACSGRACEVDAPLRARVKDEASTAWSRATGALIAGAVLLGGGITAMVLDSSDEPASSTTIAPWVSPEGGGVTGTVRF